MAVVKRDPRELGFLQALFRALIYCSCEHEWEMKVDKLIEPTFREITAGLKTFHANQFPQVSMIRQHVVVMVCKKCGKVYKSESPERVR